MNMHYLVLVCGGGPHFSENFIQSYIFNNLHFTNVSDNIIFVWLYVVPTKIGTPPKEVKNENITCSIFVHSWYAT